MEGILGLRLTISGTLIEPLGIRVDRIKSWCGRVCSGIEIVILLLL